MTFVSAVKRYCFSSKSAASHRGGDALSGWIDRLSVTADQEVESIFDIPDIDRNIDLGVIGMGLRGDGAEDSFVDVLSD